MLRFLLVVLMVLFSASLAFADKHVANGFDFPIGVPNAQPRTPSEWHVTQPFERNANSACIGDGHLGDDWNFDGGSADLDSMVYACANGIVIYAQDYAPGLDAWEGVVMVRHIAPPGHHFTLPYNYGERDEVITVYAHLWFNQIAAAVGDTILRGDLVGKIGQTPAPPSDFPHLHLAIVTDVSLTPSQILVNGYDCDELRQDQFTWPLEFIEANRSPRKTHTLLTDFASGAYPAQISIVPQGVSTDDGKIVLSSVTDSPDGWLESSPQTISSVPSVVNRGREIFFVDSGYQELRRGVVVDQTTINWSSAGDLPIPPMGQFWWYNGIAVWHDFIYLAGGLQGGGTISGRVWRGVIETDGHVDEWQETEELPTPLELGNGNLLSHDGYLYLVGGHHFSSGYSNKVLGAKILTSGLIEPWVELTQLPQPLSYQASVVAGNFLVLLGGFNDGQQEQDQILAAELLEDGQLGNWQAAGQLPYPCTNAGAVVSGGKILFGGGARPFAEPKDLFLVTINGSGLVDTITQVTDLPQTSSLKAILLNTGQGLVFVGYQQFWQPNLETGYETDGMFRGRFSLGSEKDIEYLIRSGTIPSGTTDSFRYRFSGTGGFSSWSSWSEDKQIKLSGTGDLVEYELKLEGDGSTTPELYSVALHYRDDYSGATQVGARVTATIPNGSITHDVVTQAGVCTASDPGMIQLPGGYRPIRLLQIVTSAVYQGLINVSIGFDLTKVNNQSQLFLLHRDPQTLQWQDITRYVDAEERMICGLTSGLSPILVAEYDGVTGIGDIPSAISDQLTVSCYPNPFNPRTTIRFTSPTKTEATVAIYEASGRLVATVYHGLVLAGVNEVSWDGHSDTGNRAASGVYFCKVVTPQQTATGKLVLLK